jgi:hypothetical protein
MTKRIEGKDRIIVNACRIDEFSIPIHEVGVDGGYDVVTQCVYDAPFAIYHDAGAAIDELIGLVEDVADDDTVAVVPVTIFILVGKSISGGL